MTGEELVMERTEIARLYREMYRGMIKKDRHILSEMLDESFVLAHMTGMRQSKEAFIRAVEDGTLNYSSANHQRIEAEVHGDSAELLGQSVVCAAVFGGGWHTWRLQLVLKLVRTDGVWKIKEASAATY